MFYTWGNNPILSYFLCYFVSLFIAFSEYLVLQDVPHLSRMFSAPSLRSLYILFYFINIIILILLVPVESFWKVWYRGMGFY